MVSGEIHRIETTELKDHRPWAERLGAGVLLVVLVACAVLALVAERRQRQEVCRRAEENLASITSLLSNRFNRWYRESEMRAAEFAADLAATPAFAQALREGRGNPDLQREIERCLFLGRFQGGGLLLPSGEWMAEGYFHAPALHCVRPAPSLLEGALHGPVEAPHIDLAGASLSADHPPRIVFQIEPLPEVENLLIPRLSYRDDLAVALVAREGEGAKVLWATPSAALPAGTSLSAPLPEPFALALQGVTDVLREGERPSGRLVAVSYLPATKWGLTVSMDKREVVAPIRTTTYLAWGGVLVLLLLCATVVAWLYRRTYWRTLQEGAALARALSRRLLQTGEAERLHLSHELHDTVLQHLSAARWKMDEAFRELPPSQREATLVQQARACFENARNECRRITEELRPPSIEEGDLVGALRAMARNAQAVFHSSPSAAEAASCLDGDQHTLLYRIAQQALANAAEHAPGAPRSLTLERQGAELLLEIQDEGPGFDQTAPPLEGHFGLHVMQERAALARGRWTLLTELGQGTTVRVSVPLPPLEEPPHESQ